jgi:hypothetical protein
MQEVLIVLAAVVVIGAVILRQFNGEPLRGRRIVLLPAILIVIGAMNLHSSSPLKTADIVCIAASAAVAIAIGIYQGVAIHLESRNGGLWGRMPARGLWFWGALVVSRGVVFIVASVIGAKAATSVDSIILVLGLNRLAQAAVIAARALSAGVAFSPEKDGNSFLSGLLGNAADASTDDGQTSTTLAPLDRDAWSNLTRRLTQPSDQTS